MNEVVGGFAGYLPVVSWVLKDNSLIINTIHFSGSLRVKLWRLKGMWAFSGWGVSEPLIHLTDLIFRIWVVWVLRFHCHV
jgi:hypothetical protein